MRNETRWSEREETTSVSGLEGEGRRTGNWRRAMKREGAEGKGRKGAESASVWERDGGGGRARDGGGEGSCREGCESDVE